MIEVISYLFSFTDNAAADDGIDEVKTRERQTIKLPRLLFLLLQHVTSSLHVVYNDKREKN